MAQDNMEPKKLALLRILEIFQRYSDEDHHLKQEDIIKYLERDYALFLERKAISRNISLLREAGYEISSDRNGSWLSERDFDPVELRVLIDSVLSSRFLSVEHSGTMIDKLCRQSSVYFRSNVKHIHAVNEWNKTENPELFRNIETICDAIERKKKIQYTLLRYGADKKLHPDGPAACTPDEAITCTPCGIYISGEQYHMLEIRGKGGRNSPSADLPPYAYSQPVWKMSGIRILEDNPAADFETVEEFGKYPDIPRIIREHASGSRGFAINSRLQEVRRFTIACSARNIGDAIEAFGEDIRILEKKDMENANGLVKESLKLYSHLHDNHDYHLHVIEYFRDMVTISFLASEEAVFEFVMQHAPDTCILAPEKSKELYEQRLQFMSSMQKKMSEELLNQKPGGENLK